jgi:UDP-2,3-diacylglucosamine pyrophosphatase LpxH
VHGSPPPFLPETLTPLSHAGSTLAPELGCPAGTGAWGPKLKQSQTLADKLDQRVFDAIYSRSLVYNTCWEDPKVRSIFLSDIHLGTRACQAERLLEFLRDYDSDHLFLVGDIIDFWAMSRGIYWSPAQNTVVQKILKRARHGARVVLIPGNHDEAIREYVGTSFGDIRVAHDHVHTAADGKRYLLLHGDEFDTVTRYHRWLAVLGDRAYAFVVRLNVMLSWIRRTLRVSGYWSLSGYAKRKVKSAVSFIFDFEESVVRNVKDRDLDGVICGHIHAATIRDIDGITYINCGDWVDSCTAIVEHADGRMELVHWGAGAVLADPEEARSVDTPSVAATPAPPSIAA